MAVRALISPPFLSFLCAKQLNYHWLMLSGGQTVIKFNLVLQSFTVCLTLALLIQHTQM